MSHAVLSRPTPGSRPAQVTNRGLRLDVALRGETREVRAHGRLVAGAGAAHPMWMALAREIGRDLELDLSGVTAIDAAGIGRLLHTHDRLTARRARMTITRASPQVRHLLDLVGLTPTLLDPMPATARGAAASLAPVAAEELCGCGR